MLEINKKFKYFILKIFKDLKYLLLLSLYLLKAH